jgi:hypothetical protein
MIKRIKYYLLAVMTGLTFAAPVLVPTISASAACSNIAGQVSQGANGAASGNASNNCDSGTGVNDTSITSLASKIVNIISLVVGVVAVIMVIFGGFRYITSGGDSGKVGNAKNSLVYAVVGLIIVALAQLLVHFVLNQTGNVVSQ